MNAILLALFIGVSLQSFYFYSVGMPAIAVGSLLVLTAILLYSAKNTGVVLPLDRKLGVALAFLLLFGWSAFGLIFYGEVPDFKRILGFAIMLLALLAAIHLLATIPLRDIVRVYLTVHVSFFLFQFSVYFLTGHIVDFLAPLSDMQTKGDTMYTLPLIGRLFRASGLFNEPGTYTVFIAPFVALASRWADTSRSYRWLFLISLLTLFLSFSAFAFVAALLIIISSRTIRLKYRVLVGGLGVLVTIPYMYFRWIRALAGRSMDLEFREVFIRESFAFIFGNPIGFAFGSDLLVLDPRANFIAAYNDVGLFFYFLHFAGPVLTVLFGIACLAAFVHFDRPSKLAFVILMMSKMSLFAPFFAFVLVFIFHPVRHGSRSVSRVPFAPPTVTT